MTRTMRILAALSLAAACAPASAREMDVQPRVNAELLVSAAQLAAMPNDGRTVVLHVARERAGYAAGHVPGARWLPLAAIVTERDGVPNELPPVEWLESVFEAAGVSDGSRVVLYGDLGGLAAARAFFTLDYLGHPSVALLDGGLEAWRAQGRPVSTAGAPVVRRGSFTPRARGDVLVDAAWVRRYLGYRAMSLVDARPPAEYSGTIPGDGVARPGHIAGAGSLFWRRALVSDENPVLRPEGELRALWREAGGGYGRIVVTYCRTGVQASHAYFVARYLGFDARLYDGSFIDWSRRDAEHFPVER